MCTCTLALVGTVIKLQARGSRNVEILMYMYPLYPLHEDQLHEPRYLYADLPRVGGQSTRWVLLFRRNGFRKVVATIFATSSKGEKLTYGTLSNK